MNQHVDINRQTTHPTPAVDSDERSHPRIGFATQRRLLLAMLLLCILISLVLLSTLGVVQWRALHAQAALNAERATIVAREHADKVFDLDAALSGRIEDLLTGMDDNSIHAAQSMIHIRLQHMLLGLPHITAVAIVGKDGEVLVHSRDFPVTPLSVADRDYFIALKQGRQHAISSRVVGRQMQKQVFTDSVARRNDSGEFLGAILVSLDPGYFLSFYQNMLPGEMHQSLSLVREDGSLLVRYPQLPAELAAVPPQSPFMLGTRNNPFAGTVTGISPMDGERKIISYRRVTNHDVYVVSARSLSHIWSDWLAYTGLVAALLLVPCGLLCGIIIFAMRRVNDQKIAWQHWRQELTLRHKVQSDLRESQKFEALGKLLGRVAHDFNNCLMVVATGIQIIRLKQGIGVEKQLEAIERAIKSGEQLTRQLLGVSRRQPLRPELVLLQERIPEWRLLLVNPIGAARCSIEIDDDTWPVRVDAVEMQLALINIFLNARDASLPDSPIALKAENIEQHVVASRPGRFVRIAITDHGSGMSEETRKQAFDPLFTTKEAGKGTGLGLSQVDNFAKAAGGYAQIESRSGVGTVVSIYLPAAQHTAATADVQAHPAPSLQQLILLLVEDNMDVANGIVALLQTAGHLVTHVTNALDAQQFLQQHAVDVVISDIHMPGGMTGIALAKKLQIDYPRLPVILITGYAEDLQAAIKDGLNVISKPFTLDSINRKLATLVK